MQTLLLEGMEDETGGDARGAEMLLGSAPRAGAMGGPVGGWGRSPKEQDLPPAWFLSQLLAALAASALPWCL